MHLGRLGLAALGFLLSTSIAIAATNGDWDACNGDEVELSISVCTRIIQDKGESAKDRARALVSRGRSYYTKNDNRAALRDFSEAIRLDPALAMAHNNRCAVYVRMRQFRQALADCTKAIELDPQLFLAYTSRSEAYYALSNPERAIADLTSALRIKPDYAIALRYRAFIYMMRGQHDLAIADSDAAVRSGFGKDYKTYQLRGHSYFEQGKFEEAASDHSVALWFGAEQDDGYRFKGFADFAAGDYAAAAADFVQQFNQKPNAWVLIFWYLARWRAGAPRDELNKTFASAARQVSPNDWPAQIIRLYLGQGTLDAVRQKKTVVLATCEKQYFLGAWYLMRGEPVGAVEHLKDAISEKCASVEPEYTWARVDLTRLLAALKEGR
jgi:tetratricopeptide (TPR) repeat protein